MKNLLGACMLGLSAATLSVTLDSQNKAQAATVTYDLGAGTGLGIISYTANNINDPAPAALVCSAANDTCNTKNHGARGTYTGLVDINSVNLWKDDSTSTIFSTTTNSDGTSGAWQQIWQGTTSEKITHYLAVKAAGSFYVIGYDLSLITATLVAGDIIKGAWTTGGILNSGNNVADKSHISFYNSAPVVIPIPAAFYLLLAALGGLGMLGRTKRSVAT